MDTRALGRKMDILLGKSWRVDTGTSVSFLTHCNDGFGRVLDTLITVNAD